MVGCDLCDAWHHKVCVGLENTALLGSGYADSVNRLRCNIIQQNSVVTTVVGMLNTNYWAARNYYTGWCSNMQILRRSATTALLPAGVCVI